MQGTIVQVAKGPGGIPNYACDHITVRKQGVEGDVNTNTAVHGGEERAICIFSVEVLERLAAEGFAVLPQAQEGFYNRIDDRIRPGDLGENLTTSGIDYGAIRVGDYFQVGDQVIAAVTRIRKPCDTIYRAFGSKLGKAIYDKEVKSGNHDSPLWGQSGFYMRVLVPGIVRAGNVFSKIK